MTTTRAERRPRTALRRALTGRAARATLTLAVIVAIFAGVLPRIADYASAWDLVRRLTGGEVALIAVVALVNLFSYAPLWMAALPGLTLGRAVMSDQASTAISNTVPVGFAFGVGTNAAMYHSFGFPAGGIARAVALTGVWNNLVKLAMPALALAGLALVGDVDVGFGLAALLGSGVLLAGAGVLVVVVTHGPAAAAVAAGAERLAGRVLRVVRRPAPSGWVERTERFRTDSRDLIRARWPQLSAAAVASHAALFLVLLVCLRGIGGEGADASWIVVLAAFSITRLVTIVPITPGALGVAELSYVAGLTAVGVEATAAAGAVLLFRFLTWFLPIPVGAVTWLLWRRGVGRAHVAEPVGAAR
ncbi:lysylphosphatidylglycerol synthase transmembrane domain-containing protein [Geodermatophilus sp. CPCC 205761]|uniref:lysylphosphatidylglycerol synthase transmembrane domain-containing protein n=1 Tax=Geodermatophilus sp. CPCC 205761 TaxID=2936597 RepID=UPI003EED1F1B